MASISIKDMNVSYNKGKTNVLESMNLEIKDGEFCVFLGPSGCGKSTAMQCIAGLLHPVKGSIRFGETLMSEMNGKKETTFVPPQERNIAMVFQEYALYPNMTVRENMSFALKTQKVAKEKIDQKVMQMAKMLEIEEYLDRKIANLSGGQRQRVALGRAMVRNPAVFLLDEPLSNLDAKLRTAMRAEISRLHKRLQTTFVYVTHDQTEAMTMGDRIVVMKNGIIQQNDTPQNLYDYPCNLFVAGFIGSPQMNFMDVVIEKKDDGYWARTGGGSIALSSEMDKAALAPYVGKTVVLGIRPEDIDAVPNGEAHDLEGRIEIAELMGAEINLHVDFQGVRLVVRAASTYAGREGDTAALVLDRSKIHLFDKETELAIAH